MTNITSYRIWLLLATGLAAVPGMAMAQASSSAPAPVADNAASGDIVVTALKRGENLQDVPAAVSAVTSETLQRQGLNDIRDIATVVPNLVWGEHFGTTMIVIRGVGSTIDSGITEPTVAVYADGVYLPRATMATLRSVDLERVEVLRGPAGTLYGRNATGGAINFVSKAPSRTFAAGVEGIVGSRDNLGINGYISGPLGSNFFVRVSGGREKQDGYVIADLLDGRRQRLNGTDTKYGRAAFRWEPTSTFSVDGSIRYEENDTPNTFQQLLTPSPLAPPSLQTTEKNRLIVDSPFSQNVRTLVAVGTIGWELSDAVTLKSVTSYVDHKADAASDADGNGLGIFFINNFPRPSESFGEEVTLAGDTGKLQWLVGAFYFREKASNFLPTILGDVGGPAFGLPAGSVLNQGVRSRNTSYAAYTDLTYSFTDALRLNLGLRLNYDRQKFEQVVDLSVLPAPFGANFNIKKTKLLPKVALQYEFSDDVNGYAQWSRGYKSGGANLPGFDGGLLGPVNGIYQPEQIDAFEVGLKSRLFDRTLTANFAAFYYDYKNLQISLVIPPASTQVNNADAKVYGLEGELSWRPSNRVTFNVAGTITNARFRQFGGFDDGQDPDVFGPLPAPFINLKGRPIPRAPDFTANVSADYRIPLSFPVFDELTLHGSLRYSDRLVLRYFGTDNDSQSAYATADLSATLSDTRLQLDVTGFVRNVTDKLYKQNVAVIQNAYVGNYSMPRTWGLKIAKRF